MKLNNDLLCQKSDCKNRTSGEILVNENGKCVAKCLECEMSMCTSCLLEHQLITSNLSHKLTSLVLPESETQEIDDIYSFFQEEVNTKINTEIEDALNFYIQMLKERKEYLVKELNTIIQFALLNHNQNINKQLQVQFQLEMKKQQIEKEITDECDLMNGQPQQQNQSIDNESMLKGKLNFLNELNNLILVNNQLISQLKSNNPLMSIEFISNYSAIQTSIRNTFGYIRINPQTQQVLPQQNNFSLNGMNNNCAKLSLNGLSNELSISCDFKSNNNQNQMASSGSISQQNLFSNNSTSTNVSSLSSASSTSSSSSSSTNNLTSDLVTSPVSIMVKKKTDQNKSMLTHHDQKDEKSILQEVGQDENKNQQEFKQQQQEEEEGGVYNDEDNEDDTTTLKLNEKTQQQDTITLSAGSTTSQKSCKSIVSNSSILSNNSSNCSTNLTQSAINLTNLSNTTKHPLSYLYSNFIQSNPKLNNFNFSTQCEMDNVLQNGSSSSFSNSTIKSFNSLNNLNQTSSFTLNANGHTNHSAYNLSQLNTNTSAAAAVTTSGAHLSSQIQLQRSKMIYHCKFGEFGINDGQFTEPSGVTINTNNDIIVADTNSHRIQIFDKDGNFKFKFGECGKRDGQLLYPNRVSIVKQTGDIVVTERSPTHQIQIYNKYGQFLRKFGANILQHPRGVCVDHKGRIVVVECKVMRVIIFDLYGNVLNKFNCSKYLEFPNGVCCSNPTASNNYREEIYISDNRAHCIKVFDYNGNFIRQIGAEGITNYPIGVGINSNNEILVADNHNNFNLTVFTQDGKLINALESKVKHAQCFDVGLMDDGSIVLASKDYRIYVYKYTTCGGSAASISPLSSLSLSSTASILDNHHHHHPHHQNLHNPNSISPTSANQALNFNNYDLFCNNQTQESNNQVYSLFNNQSESKLLANSALTNQLIDPFADLANEHLFNLTAPVCELQNNLASSLFSNAISSDQTDNLNASFSSLLNMSNSNSQTNANVNNLASILNGIL